MPVVDLAFKIQGKSFPADHGYLLFGALSKILPHIHHTHDGDESKATDSLGVHPIQGRAIGDRQIEVTEHSRLTLRVDSDRISECLPLAGKVIRLAGTPISIGVPEVRPLVPATRLRSRLVTVKGFMKPDAFLDAVRRQMTSLNIKSEPALIHHRSERALEGRTGSDSERCRFIRRTLRIRDKEVVGFALEVGKLSATDSIRLQEVGLGGRRHFGCGVFVPAREAD